MVHCRRPLILACVAAVAASSLLVAGCGGSSGGGGTKIALLLPENETPRYETNDRPDFEKAVEEQCEDCEVLYSNAGGDANVLVVLRTRGEGLAEQNILKCHV